MGSLLKFYSSLSRKSNLFSEIESLAVPSIFDNSKCLSQLLTPVVFANSRRKFFCFRTDWSCNRLQSKSPAFARPAKPQIARGEHFCPAHADFARVIFEFDTPVANFCPQHDL